LKSRHCLYGMHAPDVCIFTQLASLLYGLLVQRGRVWRFAAARLRHPQRSYVGAMAPLIEANALCTAAILRICWVSTPSTKVPVTGEIHTENNWTLLWSRNKDIEIIIFYLLLPAIAMLKLKYFSTILYICIICTVNSTSDYTLWTLYRSYFEGIRSKIELQVYNVTCCWPYI
jgi:hypothetical protein